MRSASECYSHAQRCEGEARAASDAVNRQVLIATAKQWRYLGDTAVENALKVARVEAAVIAKYPNLLMKTVGKA
jgi:hypothetical protein